MQKQLEVDEKGVLVCRGRATYRQLTEKEQTEYSILLCAMDNKVHPECVPWDELPFLEREMYERNVDGLTTIDYDTLKMKFERWGCTCNCKKYGCKNEEKLCTIAKHLKKQ